MHPWASNPLPSYYTQDASKELVDIWSGRNLSPIDLLDDLWASLQMTGMSLISKEIDFQLILSLCYWDGITSLTVRYPSDITGDINVWRSEFLKNFNA